MMLTSPPGRRATFKFNGLRIESEIGEAPLCGSRGCSESADSDSDSEDPGRAPGRSSQAERQRPLGCRRGGVQVELRLTGISHGTGNLNFKLTVKQLEPSESLKFRRAD
jgi:hypothetical protein